MCVYHSGIVFVCIFFLLFVLNDFSSDLVAYARAYKFGGGVCACVCHCCLALSLPLLSTFRIHTHTHLLLSLCAVCVCVLSAHIILGPKFR